MIVTPFWGRTVWIDPADAELDNAVRHMNMFEWQRILAFGPGFMALMMAAVMLGTMMGASSFNLSRVYPILAVGVMVLILCIMLHRWGNRRWKRGFQVFEQAIKDGRALEVGSLAYQVLDKALFTACGLKLSSLIYLDTEGTLLRKAIQPYVQYCKVAVDRFYIEPVSPEGQITRHNLLLQAVKRPLEHLLEAHFGPTGLPAELRGPLTHLFTGDPLP